MGKKKDKKEENLEANSVKIESVKEAIENIGEVIVDFAASNEEISEDQSEIDNDNLANDFNEEDIPEEVIEEVKDAAEKEIPIIKAPLFINDGPNKSGQRIYPKESKMVTLKDSYLPGVLVKLKFFPNNREARCYIRSEGIKLNDRVTNFPDATNLSSNFEIEFEGQKYQIFII